MAKEKLIALMVACSLVFPSFLLQGCATGKGLTMESVDQQGSIKVVRFRTPPLKRENYWRGFAIDIPAIFIMVDYSISLGLAGAFLADVISHDIAVKEGRRVTEDCGLPDYGQLLAERFAGAVCREIPGWPAMEIIDEAIEHDFAFEEGHVFFIRVNDLTLSGGDMSREFEIRVTVEMYNGKERVWYEFFIYNPGEYSRVDDIDALTADWCGLLREQMEFAAEKTSAELAGRLKKSLGLSDSGPEVEEHAAD